MLKKILCCTASDFAEPEAQPRRPSSMWGNAPRAEQEQSVQPAAPHRPAQAAPAPVQEPHSYPPRRAPPPVRPVHLPPPVPALGPMGGVYHPYEPYSLLTQKMAPFRGKDMNKPSNLKPLLLPIVTGTHNWQPRRTAAREDLHVRMPSIEEVLSSNSSTTRLVPSEAPSHRVPIRRFAPRHRPDVPEDVVPEAVTFAAPRRPRRAEMPPARPESSALPYLHDTVLADEPSPPHSQATSSSGCSSSAPRRPVSLLWEQLSEPDSPAVVSADGSHSDDPELSRETRVEWGEAR